MSELVAEKRKIEQPRGNGNDVIPIKRFHAGSERSKERLRVLGYDPIGELVATYHEILKLIELEYKYRDKEIVRLNAAGKEVNWYPDMLEKLLDKKINIADKLLRYGYGRVPETQMIEEKQMPAFIVHTTKQGAVYHTGGEDNDESVE